MKYFIAFLIILLLPASARAEFKLYTQNDLNISEFGVSIDDQKDNITLSPHRAAHHWKQLFVPHFRAYQN